MSVELRENNRVIYFRKSISTPELTSESVLTRDPFKYAELWLKRKCPAALPYWQQAQHYYKATRILPTASAPLTAYYCFLNATKALLTVKGKRFREWHGVSGDYDPTTKRSLSNEIITIQNSGIVSELSKYLEEPESNSKHSLSDILGNLPFIHRAYRHTFTSKRELFIPLRNACYRKHPDRRCVWFASEITGVFADRRTANTFPPQFEVDEGFAGGFRIRSRTRKNWYSRGASKEEIERARKRLWNLHKKTRVRVSYISAPVSLWYLKRNHSSSTVIDRYGLTLIISAMHRLSELARYDPKGLSAYFDGQANWLLTEFIELSPDQFLDELICEMTCMEFRMPGVRP